MKLLTILFSISILCPLGIADPSDPIRTAGDIGQIATPLYGLYLTYSHSDKIGRQQFFTSTLCTSIATHILKKISNKPRPDGSNNRSFPSGHTSAAFSGATFIHQRYGIKKAWPVYMVASFVGYSRVNANKHYWEDVIAGALLAGINSWLFTTPFVENTGIKVSPTQINFQVQF